MVESATLGETPRCDQPPGAAQPAELPSDATAAASAESSVGNCAEGPAEFDDWDEFPDERGRPLYLPSPAEIAAECAAVRATWGPNEERNRRARGRRVDWQVPGLDAGHSVTDREAMRTFLGTGALMPQAGDWERTSKPGEYAPMPYDD